jgi:adenylate cyclase
MDPVHAAKRKSAGAVFVTFDLRPRPSTGSLGSGRLLPGGRLAATGRPDTSLTGIAQASAKHHEAQVLAARSLENERRVTAVRLLVLALMGVSQGGIRALVGDGDTTETPFRFIAIGIYFVFSLSAFIAVRRIDPRVVTATVMPIVATTFDVGFVLAMDWCDVLEGETVDLANTTAILALIVSYSILRYSITSLFYATFAAIVAFTSIMLWSNAFDWTVWTFVVFVLVALAVLIGATRGGVRRAFIELKRRDGLARLVPTKVVEEILAGNEEVLRPTRRTVTILFSDIRGFTTYSEGRDPADVLSFLDDYLGRMAQVVQGHDGTVNKFMGDGVLALWGAPTPREDHALCAVKAAIDMQKMVREMNEGRVASGQEPIRIGIGIHTGEVAAGMLGGSGQGEYAVIGDAVNLASRIEGLTKQHDAHILVSEPAWMRLGDRFEGRRLGEFEVKGRKAKVALYELTLS